MNDQSLLNGDFDPVEAVEGNRPDCGVTMQQGTLDAKRIPDEVERSELRSNVALEFQIGSGAPLPNAKILGSLRRLPFSDYRR